MSPSAAIPLQLSADYPRFAAPGTGRHVVQLTQGSAWCYPLYYFIPTFTDDGRWLIYHQAAGGEVQLYRLELATGRSVQLTHATHPDTQWRPWCTNDGRGVRDHRSVLNVARNLVVYFDGNEARAIDVATLAEHALFSLPPDREPIGQNTTTPDGRWLVYIDAPAGSQWGQPCHGAAVVVYDFDTGQQHELCRIDSAVFHVTSYGNEHFIVTHPADIEGMMLTHLWRGGCELLREGDPGVQGRLIHCICTDRGIVYEVPKVQLTGLYDPLRRRRFEFRLPDYFRYVHTGADPAGRLWFYENSTAWNRFDVHDLHFLVALGDDGRRDSWQALTGTWPTYGGGQKAHFHPRLTPDRRWILFSGGDPASQTTHLFLLDTSDLADSQGIDEKLLSPTGANDRV